VVLGKQGEVFLNNKPITLDGLREESQKSVTANPETTALLVADKDSTLEMVTELVDAVKGGGVKKVAFSIQKKR
jgi:biopolymer transport protein ExbD